MYVMLMLSEEAPDIRLYVAYHKELILPTIPSLTFLRSDSAMGENIAHLTDYCELRAQFYVWKNTQSKYVGFFHYRRYLELDKGKLVRVPARKRPDPYRILRMPEPRLYSTEKIAEIASEFDVIAPVREYTGLSVRDRYAISPGHRSSDLRIVEGIISEKYPEYHVAAKEYLDGRGEYFANMYIMERGCFEDYCRWLFDILKQFDQTVKSPLPRTDGFLGERLFGIYFTWMNTRKFKCAELPRLHFYGYDDKRHNFSVLRFINSIIPAGSRRRAVLRFLQYCILKGRKE